MTVDTLPATAPAARCCDLSPAQTLPPERAVALAALSKALADPVRVQLVEVLRAHTGEVCQCDLQPLFAVSQPTLSHHLRKLREAGIVDVERRGVWAYYSIRPDTLEVLRKWLS